jgi:hypothetical protein
MGQSSKARLCPAAWQLCLRGGSWLPPSQCPGSYTFQDRDTCASVIASQFSRNYANFFSLNPEVSCGDSYLPGQVGLTGTSVGGPPYGAPQAALHTALYDSPAQDHGSTLPHVP